MFRRSASRQAVGNEDDNRLILRKKTPPRSLPLPGDFGSKRGSGTAVCHRLAMPLGQIGVDQRIQSLIFVRPLDRALQMAEGGVGCVFDGGRDKFVSRSKMTIEAAVRETSLGHDLPDAHGCEAVAAKPVRSGPRDAFPDGKFLIGTIIAHLWSLSARPTLYS